MALVITLILLSVTLVMALAFLAISTRERTSITTATDTAIARNAADAGLAAAEGQIVANVLASKNPYSYGLLVSTNYINGAGFQPGVANLTNVNYDYLTTGGPLNPNQFEQNLANLNYSPRAPVFVATNAGGPLDFRFYLDLNRNGMFDTNGLITNLDNAGNIVRDGSLKPVVTFQVGDPEWIGVLEHPDQPYWTNNNRFVSRFAYFCQPIGNAYDLNYLHNQTLIPPLNYQMNPMVSADDSYYRNQGVGSWEINLPAFLADLNTNEWGQIVGSGSGAPAGSANYYQYNRPAFANVGAAFADAFSLLNYRYAGNYNSLALVGGANGLFTNSTTTFPPFQNNIDFYTDFTPPMTFPSVVNAINQQVNVPWAGADNTNHFFDLSSDLFDPAKSSAQFIGRLSNAGTGTATSDRYTFYRLLDQLGTGSAPESGKMNLNYDNLTPNVNGIASTTNFFAWTPLGFFTNAADRMLRAYTTDWLGTDTNSFNNFTNTFGASVTNAFGITNIPVLVNGRMVYSPAVQRILQLAANMYDSVNYANNFVTASGGAPAAYLPSVFRPIINKTVNGNVYINGFSEVTNVSQADLPLSRPYDVTNPNDLSHGLRIGLNFANVYGVPMIIGAKKGFPNFNQFAMQTALGITRKLQMTRTSPDHKVQNPITYPINQMFTLNLSNQVVVECWNSYANNYTRPVYIYANDYLGLSLTNDEGFIYATNLLVTTSPSQPEPLNSWSGYNVNKPGFSAQIPLFTNLLIIPDSIYRFITPPRQLVPDTLNATYEQNVVINGSKYPQPLWGLLLTNNLQVIMVDANSGRLIDYVQLNGPTTNLNINPGTSGLWGTNLNNGVPAGIGGQIAVSLGSVGGGTPPSPVYWGSESVQAAEDGIDGFRAFYLPPPVTQLYNNPGEAQIIALALVTNSCQLPYTPSTNFMQYVTWQANDPLVHYLASDLNDTQPFAPPINPLITRVPNYRYQPWGAPMLQLNNSDPNTYNLSIKDPRVYSSDDWDFPTNKFPTVGWLGRVHRGTPWQTVYLKASNILNDPDTGPMKNSNYGRNTWENWTGDFNTGGYDAANSSPTTDRLLFDLFTTAPNDNATRGQLPVNQQNFAAWSALFSGMAVPTNLSGASPVIINPAGAAGSSDPYVYALFNSINGARAFANLPSKTFKHVGDVLAASALTEQSPFLNWKAAQSDPNGGNISEELYEWLPQQMMSLLKISTEPRYVIYSYGQTLAPAGANAIETGGNYSGMVTNYQVVAETVTRSIVRIVGAPTNTHAVVESFNLMPPK